MIGVLMVLLVFVIIICSVAVKSRSSPPSDTYSDAHQIAEKARSQQKKLQEKSKSVPTAQFRGGTSKSTAVNKAAEKPSDQRRYSPPQEDGKESKSAVGAAQTEDKKETSLLPADPIFMNRLFASPESFSVVPKACDWEDIRKRLREQFEDPNADRVDIFFLKQSLYCKPGQEGEDADYTFLKDEKVFIADISAWNTANSFFNPHQIRSLSEDRMKSVLNEYRRRMMLRIYTDRTEQEAFSAEYERLCEMLLSWLPQLYP